MKGWSQADIDRLQAKGLYLPETIIKNLVKKVHPPKSEPKGKVFIESILKARGEDYVKELQFAKPTRKFRFDYAIPGKMIAIEYDGLISEKSRHTTITGFTRDCTKHNLAAMLGWRVLRYTATNYKDFERDIKLIV